jgi:hypothetical protein
MTCRKRPRRHGHLRMIPAQGRDDIERVGSWGQVSGDRRAHADMDPGLRRDYIVGVGRIEA